MKNRYEKNYTIGPSDCDHTSRMGMPAAFEAFMDIASEHAELLNIGVTFMKETGLFWLTAKTRVHIYKSPRMEQKIVIETWPLKPRGIQEIRDYRIRSESGEVFAEGKTQWAMLDTKSGELIRMEDLFPGEFEFAEEKVLDEPFMRVKDDISDCEEIGSYTVRSVDIDLGGHMNNSAYVRALFGVFSTRELNAMKISDCEVSFKKTCYEGDVLRFFKRTTDGGTEVVVKNKNNETAILAVFRKQDTD